MTDSESTQTQPQTRNGNATESFRIENIEIIKRGQVTITKQHRTEHDLAIGDYIDLTVYYDDSTISVPDVQIGESGRVIIPSHQRNRYGLTEGDEVEVEVDVE